jgi:GTP pyrophosphokinase
MAIGAKVDGKLMALDSKLKSGQMVEILIDKNKKKPSRDWLDFVVTQVAKREISRHFKKR